MKDLFEYLKEILGEKEENKNYEVDSIIDNNYNDYYVDFLDNIKGDKQKMKNYKAGNKIMKREGVYKTEASGSTKDVFMGEDARKIIHKEIGKNDPKIHIGYSKGINNVRSNGVKLSDLDRHGVIFGQTGAGKTTLMLNMLNQIGRNNNNFIFVTPKPDDPHKLLQILPEEVMEKTDILYPGSKKADKTVSINPIGVDIDKDREEYEQIVENKKTLMKNLITSKYGSGAKIGPLTGTLAKETMKTKAKYGVPEFIDIIINEESRNEFTESELLYSFSSKLKEQEDDDLEPIQRRTKDLEEIEPLRETFLTEESDINFKDYVMGDRNLIVNLSKLTSQKQKETFGVLVLLSIWNAGQIRNAQIKDEQERDLVTLMIDEFHQIITKDNYEQTNIKSFLSEARQYQLSVVAASQFPHQIPNEVLEEIKENTNLKISFTLGDKGSKTATTFYPSEGRGKGVTPEKIRLIDRFEFIHKEKLESGEKRINKVQSYPIYPYLRSRKKAEEYIVNNINKKGSKRIPENVKVTEISKVGEMNKLSIEDICKAIKVGRYKKDDQYIKIDLLKDIINSYREKELGYNDLESILERKERFIKTKSNNDNYIGLTEKGEEKAEQSSGGSGSAGKYSHRKMLTDIQKEFIKEDIYVIIPEQEGPDDQADGIGYKLPNTTSKLNQILYNKQEKQDKLMIETEKNTLKKPARVIKNYIKSNKKGYSPIFIVTEEDKARKVNKILYNNPKLYNSESEKGKRAYSRKQLTLDKTYNKTIKPVFNKGNRSRWYVKDNKAILYKKKSNSEEKILEIKIKQNGEYINIKQFRNKILDKINKFDKVLENRENSKKIVNTNTNEEKEYNKKEYTKVQEPEIPELRTGKEIKIKETDYTIIINNDNEFSIYNKNNNNKKPIRENNNNTNNKTEEKESWKDKI